MRSRSATTAPARRAKPARSTASFKAIVEGIATPLLLTDRRGRVDYRNPAAQMCFGDSDRIETLLGSVSLPPPSANWTTLIHQALSAPAGVELPCTWVLRADATTRQGTIQLRGLASKTTRRSRSPAPTSEIVAVTFIESPSANSEAPSAESHRLESLGKLAARVAHELNNPLDGIIRYINLALRLADDSPESKLKNYLFESRTGLLRMVQIVGDLLEYSRNAGEGDELGVNEIVEQAIGIIAGAADDRRIVLAVDFQHRDMPKFRGTRLFQVLVNLLRNAIDAMPGGGRLTITSGLMDNDVILRVADTGPGLPLPIERVFEPFFTTKPPGKGTGLGLAISKEFVEGMGGTIRGENSPTGGAVLTVKLPSDQSRPDVQRDKGAGSPAPCENAP